MLAWCFADPAVRNMHSALFTGWKVNTGLTFLFAPTSHTCVMSIIALPLSGTDKTTMGMGVRQLNLLSCEGWGLNNLAPL